MCRGREYEIDWRIVELSHKQLGTGALGWRARWREVSEGVCRLYLVRAVMDKRMVKMKWEEGVVEGGMGKRE